MNILYSGRFGKAPRKQITFNKTMGGVAERLCTGLQNQFTRVKIPSPSPDYVINKTITNIGDHTMWILSIVVFALVSGQLQEQYVVKSFKSEAECKAALKEFAEADVNKNINFLVRCMAKEQYDQIKNK